MSTVHQTELERFRQFIDEKLGNEEANLSLEETVRLFRQTNQSPELDEALGYHPIPPKATTTKRIKYRRVGRGQPLPYTLDEEALDLEENEQA